MRRLRALGVRLLGTCAGRDRDREIAAELESHLSLHVDDLIRSGMDPAEARRRALLDLGGLEPVKESCRDQRGLPLLESILQDTRHAARILLKTPGFTAVAVLSLALGIGANTAIFSILNSLLLKPLPVDDPNSLVVLGSAGDPQEEVTVNYHVWKSIREHRLFDKPFAWAADRVGLATNDETRFAEAIWGSGDFFEVLGVDALLGRTFTVRDDTRSGGPDGPVAVISYPFWLRRYGGTADALGRILIIERVPFTVVGVTPPHFMGVNVGTAFDVILPLETEPLLGRVPARLESPYRRWLQIMARLRPGQSPETLTAALRNAQPLIREATMPPYGRAEDRERYLRGDWAAVSAPGGVSRFRRQYGPALVTLLAVVGLVLLIACANIAMLMLARATARRYEFSLRLALGASRLRLARQVLSESLLLATAGAILGLALAHWGSRVLVQQLSTWAYAAVLDLSPDWRVLAVTVAATLATAVLFGTAAALRVARVEPIDPLKQRRGGLEPHGRVGVGASLIVVQVALSLVLLVAAGLFLRSFAALAYRDLGFDRGRVLVAIVNTQRSAVTVDGRAGLYERLREAAAGVPGVESTAISMATPVGSAGVRFTPAITILGTALPLDQEIRILTHPVSPDWFRTFGTRITAGRDFDAHDRSTGAQVAIVNEAFARRYFDAANPVGGTLVEMIGAGGRRPWEIVGVVEDAAFTSVREPVEPMIYRPFAQFADDELLGHFPTITVSVRSAQGSPARLSSALAAAITGVDTGLEVSFQTLTEQLNAFYIRERLLAMVSGFFGVFAVLLAALGLYGLLSYALTHRRAEIGLRMALGADPSAVVRMMLGRVSALAAVGIGAGLAASLWASRLVGALLYAVPARDSVTFASAAAVLAIVAIGAAWLPARRAARLDPATVLREGAG